MTTDMLAIREMLANIRPDVSSSVSDPPEPRDIYAPLGHGAALDPNRTLVVGSRGMGKSFWAAAYTSSAARHILSQLYPRIGLDNLTVAQGFTGEEVGEAPSRRVLNQLISAGISPEDLWRAVMFRAITRSQGDELNRSLREYVSLIEDAETSEQHFRSASDSLVKSNKRLVVVFDALDRLGEDWPRIRALTLGLLRTALDFRPYRGLGLKIFMRLDQFEDGHVFGFPDASKLKAEAVRLEWQPRDLYGLVFTQLARSDTSASSFEKVTQSARIVLEAIDGLPTLPLRLREDEVLQESVLQRIAGKYMGADHRKGRTYTWLTNHLTDAKSEVSPRSFLRALSEAARTTPAPPRLAIDPNGIREGIKAASEIRFEQLLEDHGWARRALEPLADQSVPCDERDFLARWRSDDTIQKIALDVEARLYLGPVELVDVKSAPESALLDAFIRLGVVERRTDNRINMPDIYRVAANLLRRGGVPPQRQRRAR